MSTKREILTQAGRLLGDTSTNFITDILSPSFDFVLADLASFECIDAVRRSRTFQLRAGVRDYETREICQVTPHYPANVVSLTVWAWGLSEGRIQRRTDTEFEALRLVDGESKTGKCQYWRLYPNHRNLQVHPPLDDDNDNTDCEIVFAAPWAALDLDDDVLNLQQEDIECVALGLQVKGAYFAEQLQQDRMNTEAKYQAAKKRMWGRRWVRPGRIIRREGL